MSGNDFSSTNRRATRRQFGRAVAGAAAGAFAAPAILRGRNLNEKLNIAMIGVGPPGRVQHAAVRLARTSRRSATCSSRPLDKAAASHPRAKQYRDFRKMYDHASEFDAVVVSTTEHTHAFATLPALQLGKHVYCEKPLTHNICEARIIREAAAKTKVATQMGTQIHAGDNYRRVVELIQAGAIGPVHEAHVWVSRAWGRQSRGRRQAVQGLVSVRERPSEPQPVPTGLDWDLWLGPAPERPFHEVYFPGPKWYRWWDFGNGTMSDLGSHWNDLPFWALKLHAPADDRGLRARRRTRRSPRPRCTPSTSTARAARCRRSPSTWYQGEEKPEPWRDGAHPQVGRRRAVHRRQGDAPVQLRQARPAPREGLPRLHAARAVHPQVAGPLGGVGPRLQDRRADDLPLRLRRPAHRGQPPGQRRLPHRQEDRVGPGQDVRHQRPRSRCLHPPRLPQGMVAGVTGVSAVLNQ